MTSSDSRVTRGPLPFNYATVMVLLALFDTNVNVLLKAQIILTQEYYQLKKVAMVDHSIFYCISSLYFILSIAKSRSFPLDLYIYCVLHHLMLRLHLLRM